ncbi:MAG: hypothetical protein MMC33_001689 [Icmadophila ericetorum]|nr:hypothetical protein [Icmadophila ericetorum]
MSGTPDPSAYTITGRVLEDNHILRTNGQDNQGNTGTSAVDLDSVIGNVNGALSWGATGFSSQARNVALSADGNTLDAELPDSNGDFNPSTLAIAQDIGIVDGDVALRMAFGIPHSTAHAQTSSADEADQLVLNQIVVPPNHPPVTKVQTLQASDLYSLANNPTAPLVQANGPAAGAAISVISDVGHVVAVAQGLTEAKQNNSCVIL